MIYKTLVQRDIEYSRWRELEGPRSQLHAHQLLMQSLMEMNVGGFPIEITEDLLRDYQRQVDDKVATWKDIPAIRELQIRCPALDFNVKVEVYNYNTIAFVPSDAFDLLLNADIPFVLENLPERL